MPGKVVKFDNETFNALKVLASDAMKDFQELADEAFADLLKKHGVPVDLKAALRDSVRQSDNSSPSKPRSTRTKSRPSRN